MSEPIVVGTDGSGESDRAVDWAAAEAALRERPLRIVHAVPGRSATALFAAAEKAGRLARAGHAVVDAAGARVRDRWPDVETTTVVVEDETSDALRRHSEDAFELVLGRRGRGGFASLLLGSTSLRMASRSGVPVVIVRGGEAGGEAGAEVVAGIDPRKETGAVLDYAFDAAARRGARLRVVHAWQMSTTLIDAGYTAEDADPGPELRRQVAAACEPLQRRYPQVDAVGQVVLEHPVQALTGPSRTARLLVVGARERRWSSPRLGSTGHGVVHHAQCPVAVVPPPSRR
ncbi:universal stress protein [Actinomadura sp. GC306]|uniref:universal stress protein n=1 Tax=Actinomadura sp. GC306 TaxID=2530367 RepID=UPI0010477580|nr:universal stress protein [Actinomadura sp. GC306]TDC64747.1 universal stress protein [Actinomadura sp. GC306]